MMIYKNNMETEGAYGAYNADRHEWSGAGKPGSLLETTLNTRELGGYRTKSGACTGWGTLIRSDMHKAPSERDIAYLSEKRISTIIDMRGKRDVADAPSPFAKMDAFHYYNIPIEEGSGIPESVEAVPGSYMKIASSANMVWVYRRIARAPEGVLFHCSAGKDRTGVVSAVLLLLAGVSDADIIENYMLTKICNQERFALLHQNFSDIDMNIVIPREAYMIRFLELFREAYGSVEAYLETIGVSIEEMLLLREKLGTAGK